MTTTDTDALVCAKAAMARIKAAIKALPDDAESVAIALDDWSDVMEVVEIPLAAHTVQPQDGEKRALTPTERAFDFAANQWADAFYNAVHGVRNVASGIATQDQVLDNLTRCAAHCQEEWAKAKALAASPTQSEAGDWVTVLREPTEAMIEASCEAACEYGTPWKNSSWDKDGPAGESRHRVREGQRLGLIAALAASPTQPEGLRPEVLAFAHLMEAQLRANDHKPGWKGDPILPLFDRLLDEAEELRICLGSGTPTTYESPVRTIGREAADVANFAMMIADVCGALTSPPRGEAQPEQVAREALEKIKEEVRRGDADKLPDYCPLGTTAAGLNYGDLRALAKMEAKS